MRALFLPYQTEFDPETRTYCIIGKDSHGDPFGVGAGATRQEGEEALREFVLEVLDFQATRGLDHFGDLLDVAPAGDHVAFDPVELLPIRLKLARVVAGLRQADMAERLGITQQAYAKLEGRTANPTIRTIVQAERALGVELVTFIPGPTRGIPRKPASRREKVTSRQRKKTPSA